MFLCAYAVLTKKEFDASQFIFASQHADMKKPIGL
jgi:hypothetical protein